MDEKYDKQLNIEFITYLVTNNKLQEWLDEIDEQLEHTDHDQHKEVRNTLVDILDSLVISGILQIYEKFDKRIAGIQLFDVDSVQLLNP